MVLPLAFLTIPAASRRPCRVFYGAGVGIAVGGVSLL
jgi:hypothetical protein